MRAPPLKNIPLLSAPRHVVGLDESETAAFRKGWIAATLAIHRMVNRYGAEITLKAQPLKDIEETRLARLIDKGRNG